MFGKLFGWLASKLVTEVPPEIAACESCGQSDCNGSKWRDCPFRLAVEQDASMLDRESQIPTG